MLKYDKVTTFFILLFILCYSVSFAEENRVVLSLEETLSIARENNPTMVEAYKSGKIAEARLKSSKKFMNPELGFDAAKLAHDLEESAQYDSDNLEGEIRIDQPLQLWGKRKLSIEIAEDELKQAVYQLEDLWRDIAYQVKKQYNETLVYQKKMELSKDHLERAQRFLDQVNIKFNAGKARNYELTRSRLEVSSARNSFLKDKTSFHISMGKLNLLLGRNIKEELILEDRFTFLKVNEDMSSLMTRALHQRADILSQEWELKEKEKQLKLARLKKLPDMNMGLFAEREEQIYSAGVGVSFEIPLWNQYQEEIEEFSLERELSEMRLETLKNEVSLDVYSSYSNLELAGQFIVNLEQAMKEANELLRIITVEYQEGEASFLAYLEGLVSYKETKQEYLESLADHTDKIAALEWAVGGELTLEKGK